MLVIYILGAYLTAILDAIFNISKRSMMPEWHQLDSSSTMSEQQESARKKTLKSSSRSFWFSTGLFQQCGILGSVDSDELVRPSVKLINFK